MPYQGLIRKYREHLPVREDCIVTLNEGATPLLPCVRLACALGIDAEIYLKLDGMNPTCSFKDRGMTYAVSKAKEAGSDTVLCASTGNTSASAAAYAARAGMKSVVLIPKGKIAYGKLSQAIRHGARIVQIQGNFDDALKTVIEIAKDYPLALVNSVNPHRLRGQMTAAFEVVEDLGDAPDYHFLPVGNAGNITAYWMGYEAFHREGKCRKLPKMMGVQAKGAAPIVRGRVVKNPETFATAIRIGNPASWTQALSARDASGGSIDMVSDAEIRKAYHLLAATEGCFCEPASAASVAGLIKFVKQKKFAKGQKIVCTLTGHGLKDPDSAIEGAAKPLVCKAEIKVIIKKLGF
jgi:threonine synthase